MARKPEEIAETELAAWRESRESIRDCFVRVLRDYGNEALERAVEACDALQKDARGQARYAAAQDNALVQRDYEARAEAANDLARTIRALKEEKP